MNENISTETNETKKIKVFVTYAWEDNDHNERVNSFTDFLRTKGFDAYNDKFIIQQSSSTDLQAMMLRHISQADKVLVLLTKKYAEKADKLEGGVGIEYQLILKDIDSKPQKYILASFDPYDESLFPLSFRKREMVSITDQAGLNNLYQKLKGISTYRFSDVANDTPDIEVKPIPAFEFKSFKPVDVTMNEDFDDDSPIVWDVPSVEKAFNFAVETNDITRIRNIIQNNSFLLYDIYERKGGALPIFHDLTIGPHKVDFAWLNDASSGPEWVLLSVSKSQLSLFDVSGHISNDILRDIEAIKALGNYFELNPDEKKRIFGAVTKFKYQLVIGSYDQWQTELAQKWRLQHNKTSLIEIRSYNTFAKSLSEVKRNPGLFYRFNQFHATSSQEKLEIHWKNYSYMDSWRKLL